MLYQLSYCRILLCLIVTKVQLFFVYSKCFTKSFSSPSPQLMTHYPFYEGLYALHKALIEQDSNLPLQNYIVPVKQIINEDIEIL